jgi:hypothetical protein
MPASTAAAILAMDNARKSSMLHCTCLISAMPRVMFADAPAGANPRGKT